MNDQEKAGKPGGNPARQTGPVTSTAVCYACVGKATPGGTYTAIMSQLAALHEYAALRGDSRASHITDMGQSANSTARPGLRCLFTLADEGTLQRCYITNRAILARNHSLLTTLLDRFDSFGVTITFLEDHPDTLEHLDA